MQSSRLPLLVNLLLSILVFGAGLIVYGIAARRVPFSFDEGYYLYRARYFGYLVLDGDLFSSRWGDSYWTHTHPMLTNYVVGAGLLVRGIDLDSHPSLALRLRQLRLAFDGPPGMKTLDKDGAPFEIDRHPELIAARAPMVLLASATAVVIFLLGATLAGPIAGLTAAALAMASPLTQLTLVRAVSEPPLTFFAFLALLLAVLGARRGRSGGIPRGWAIAVGVAAGLAASAKLTGALSAFAIALWGAMSTLWTLIRRRDVGERGRSTTLPKGWALSIVVATAVFVLHNPHLYPNPIEHVLHLITTRAESLERQRQNWPQVYIENRLDRILYTLETTLVRGTWTGSRGLPLELPLASIGLGSLLFSCWRRAWRERVLAPEGLVLVTGLAYLASVGSIGARGVDRYYLQVVLFGCLLSGFGVVVVANALVGGAEGLRTARMALGRVRRLGHR